MQHDPMHAIERIRHIKRQQAKSFDLVVWRDGLCPKQGQRHTIRSITLSEQPTLLDLVRTHYGF